jgi:hypothetical protein
MIPQVTPSSQKVNEPAKARSKPDTSEKERRVNEINR